MHENIVVRGLLPSSSKHHDNGLFYSTCKYSTLNKRAEIDVCVETILRAALVWLATPFYPFQVIVSSYNDIIIINLSIMDTGGVCYLAGLGQQALNQLRGKCCA